MPRKKKTKKDLEAIRELVNECIATHQEEFLINLIYKLKHEYHELARLSTFDSYKETWSHKKLLDFLTKEM
jgi:hypothetical protein